MGYVLWWRPIPRKIGDLIVTLTESHVVAWRVGKKSKQVRVALSELAAAIDRVRPTRGWVPRIGEEVATGGNQHRAKVQAVIPAMPEPLVRVRYPKGSEKLLDLSEVKPVGNGPVAVQCERSPFDDEDFVDSLLLFDIDEVDETPDDL